MRKKCCKAIISFYRWLRFWKAIKPKHLSSLSACFPCFYPKLHFLLIIADLEQYNLLGLVRTWCQYAFSSTYCRSYECQVYIDFTGLYDHSQTQPTLIISFLFILPISNFHLLLLFRAPRRQLSHILLTNHEIHPGRSKDL